MFPVNVPSQSEGNDGSLISPSPAIFVLCNTGNSFQRVFFFFFLRVPGRVCGKSLFYSKNTFKKNEREMKTFGYAQKKSSFKDSISSKKWRESDILFNVWKSVEDTGFSMSFLWLRRDDT